MLPGKETTRISKFISLLLRHRPETIGLRLDRYGWADVQELVEKMNAHGFPVTRAMLEQVVATNSKKRFSFNEDGTRIRANQGHSLEVDLQLQPVEPPATLFHGTAAQWVASILQSGLEKKERQHVHLSDTVDTALAVGGRHGKPRVLVVAAGQMHRDGYAFYRSENNVWLTDTVPPSYLKLLETT